MKFGGRSAIIAAAAATMACLAPLLGAKAEQAPHSVFACSLGRKSVSVTSVGNQLTYSFGTPGHTEISITGNGGQGNVLFREDRYANTEYQLRFMKGEFSYIVYSMAASRVAGTAAVSGLTVRKGAKTVADMPCTRFTYLKPVFDYDSLPVDTEEYSAM